MNKIVEQMAIKNGELIRQFNFKVNVYAYVRYQKHPEPEPTEVTNHDIPIEITNNLTRLELNDIDNMARLDH